MKGPKEYVLQKLQSNVELHRKCEPLAPKIASLAQKIAECYKKGGKLVLFGNGGSAADAQHIAAELVGKMKRERKALFALALNANASSITAIANDLGYEFVFARQVEGIVRKGDVAIGISTSGNSKNVVLGLEAAEKMGAFAASLCGAGGDGKGGMVGAASELCIAVPSTDTQRVQEVHIFIGHTVCELVEIELFGE